MKNMMKLARDALWAAWAQLRDLIGTLVIALGGAIVADTSITRHPATWGWAVVGWIIIAAGRVIMG